jgi:telomerase Cajal body protein 1
MNILDSEKTPNITDENEMDTSKITANQEEVGTTQIEMEYFKDQSAVELAKANFPNKSSQHYTKGASFSPDGTCLLLNVNSIGMLCYEIPRDLYQTTEIDIDREITTMKPVIHIESKGNLYDYQWYPYMTSTDESTCFWISSSQNEPIKMFDAFTGKYKCSYRAYDYADELEAALSCSFSGDGQCIFGGYKKSIKVFTTAIPGRDYDTINLNQPISCLATNYYENNILAAGSWNRTITLIDTRDYLTIDTLSGHRGGLTYLKYSSKGEFLISGSRKDSNLLLWDMRNLSLPLFKFTRRVDTNQKIYFDISMESQWLTSGDTRGIIHVWNLKDLNDEGFPKETQFQFHQDCCSGVSLHPYLPIIATGSGQFKFNNEDDIQDEQVNETIVDNSVVMWWIGNSKTTSEV